MTPAFIAIFPRRFSGDSTGRAPLILPRVDLRAGLGETLYSTPPLVQGGLDSTKGDFDWPDVDQSSFVGAETSYAWFPRAYLVRSINTSPG